jgi:hypothetical protein
VTIEAMASATTSWMGTTTAASSSVLRKVMPNFQCVTMRW